MASSSATTGRESRKARTVRDVMRARETARQLLALCVHGDRQPETRRFTQAIEQGDIVHAGKFGKARVAHERLESDDAARGHLGHVGHRAGHESTP